MEPRVKTIRNYAKKNGKSPFEDWLRSIRDTSAVARILTRIDRLRFGNFGDCKSVGAGVFELRIHFGPGFRVYFGLIGADLVLLLCGGDKSSQKKDIELSQKYWKEYRNGN